MHTRSVAAVAVGVCLLVGTPSGRARLAGAWHRVAASRRWPGLAGSRPTGGVHVSRSTLAARHDGDVVPTQHRAAF